MTIVYTTSIPGIDTFPIEGCTVLAPHERNGYASEQKLAAAIENADILVSTYDYPVTAELIRKAKNLKLIANFGVGFNNIDIAFCKQHGILVTNTPQPVIEPTAEHCFALMHTIAHRTAELDSKLRMPDYGGIRFGVMNNLGVSLYGKTLGIIGMGRIGQAVARRAVACGMKIVYHNRHRLPAEKEAPFNAEYVEMDRLLRESDYVSLNLPYTPEVHHLINAEALGRMKPSAILINTARGAHIDEKALVEALQKGTIAGAALDVYEHEPAISEELLRMDNVVLSPHIGTGTIDGRRDMADNVIENIRYFINGETDKMNLVY